MEDNWCKKFKQKCFFEICSMRPPVKISSECPDNSEFFNSRKFTEEEQEEYRKIIDELYKPTGRKRKI